MIHTYFSWVHFIQSERNLGFAVANNLGAKYCRGRNLLFLNPDTEVRDSALQNLLRFLDETPSAGIAGPKLLNPDSSVQTSCVQSFPTILNQALDSERLRRLLPESALWGNGVLLQALQNPVPVEVVAGACLMIKTEVFERAGCFNQVFFMYAEDVDLCFQTRQGGWQTYYVPSACVVHHGGQSSDNQTQTHFAAIVMRESILRFFVLRRSPLYGLSYRAITAAGAIVRVGLLRTRMVATMPKGRTRLRVALRKWTKTLRWAIGLEQWSKQLRQGTIDEDTNSTAGRRIACCSAAERE
jgi:hypothetical protein